MQGPANCEQTGANSANSVPGELFEQGEQRTVRTVHIVRTANGSNSSHWAKSSNDEQCEQFIFLKSSNTANRREHCSAVPGLMNKNSGAKRE